MADHFKRTSLSAERFRGPSETAGGGQRGPAKGEGHHSPEAGRGCEGPQEQGGKVSRVTAEVEGHHRLAEDVKALRNREER